MKKFSIKAVEKAGSKGSTLESRLLQFYILTAIIWAFVISIACALTRMPFAMTCVYGGYFLGLILYFTIGYKVHKGELFGKMFFFLLLIIVPVLWYFSGGYRTAAGILFVCQLSVYVMCLKGRKQKIFIFISLISSGMIQGISRNLPQPVYPMEDAQYVRGGSILGITTCLLIASLLIRQKHEYMLERDAAIASEKELERSNRLQKNFLANMSHEIRSPLGIVLGFNNLIKGCDNLEQIHEYSKDIEQSGTTLLAVINDILNYSKIESGKLDIIEVDYCINSLVDEINHEMLLKCDEKGLKYACNMGNDIPGYLFGDNIRIKQCLLNILSNAVKYTEKGTITFNIEKMNDSTDELCKLKFSVADTGKGISEEALPNLFTAFQRLDEGMNRGIEGTGLGLAITKGLLDEMHGDIEVESGLGEGSIFTIYIDQKIGKEVEGENAQTSEDLTGIRVLVVDDAKLNLTLVRKLLEKVGAIVTTLDNGKDCLDDVKVNKYDVILVDHMMPDMNGVEVFERMRLAGGINVDTPVVMLTANAMAGVAQEYLEMGFDGYLSKPISTIDLNETVYRLSSGK